MFRTYLDFLAKFIHPSKFQMCEMDTDSAYLATSEDSLDAVEQEMKAWYLEKHTWFSRDE